MLSFIKNVHNAGGMMYKEQLAAAMSYGVNVAQQSNRANDNERRDRKLVLKYICLYTASAFDCNLILRHYSGEPARGCRSGNPLARKNVNVRK